MLNTRLYNFGLFAVCAILFSSCQYDLDELNAMTTETVAEAQSMAASEQNITPQPTDPSSSTVQQPEKQEEAAPAPGVSPSTSTPAAPATPQGTGSDARPAPPMLNVPTFGYYNIPPNTPPLFSPSCLLSEDPSGCSRKMLREWLTDQLRRRDNGLTQGNFSIQYISFEISPTGEVENVIHYGSKGSAFCRPCIEIALETIEDMPRWMPAMSNGKPVRVSLKLPLRFEVI